MIIDVTCPKCCAVYLSDEAHIGKHLRCSKCGCHVPILIADRAVVQSLPNPQTSVPHFYTAAATLVNRRNRNTWALAVVLIVIVLGAASLVMLRRSNSGSAHISDIDKKADSDSTQKDSFDDIDSLVAQHKAAEARQSIAAGATGTANLSDFEPENAKSTHVAVGNKRPTAYNSLPSGTRIAPDIGTNGHGMLTVENGMSVDAVVRLYDTTSYETRRWFSVQANGSAHVVQIPEGTYILAYTTGLNWVESKEVFSWHPSYSEFERVLQYREQRDSDGLQYHDISVTLQPVVGGNVRARVISREEFLKGHKHMPLQQ